MQTTDLVRAAIGRYHDLLAGRELASTVELVQRMGRREDLRYAGRPVCTVLRPAFLEARTYRAVCRVASIVTRAIHSAARRLLVDVRLRRLVGLTDPAALRLMRIEDRNGAPFLYGRLDGMLSASGDYRLIEYSGTPGGIIFGDRLARGFAGMPIMKALARRVRFRALPVPRYLVDAYRRAHRQWGAKGPPRILVVDRGLLAREAFVEKRAILSLLRDAGFEVHVARSEDLRFRRDRLLAGDFAADVVYYLADAVLEPRGEDALIRALERRAVWLVIGPRTPALFGKATFQILSDPAHSHLFDPPTARLLARVIPWTRVVREGRTTHDGRAIDLVEFVVANRDRLVLKPSDGSSSAGVVLGWTCDQSAWERAVRDALERVHVVQERVPLGGGLFPEIRKGKLALVRHGAGLDPYTWNGTTARGCNVRLSTGPLLGMRAAHNSVSPLFLLE